MFQGNTQKMEVSAALVCSPGSSSTSDPSRPQAARRLLSAFHSLIFRDDEMGEGGDICSAVAAKVDLRIALGNKRAKAFLASLEDMAHALQLGMASRKYRQTFTRNYRTLMPSDRRLYRLDVLEAAQDGLDVLWVNGKKYVLGAEVIEVKSQFRASWYRLISNLCDMQAELNASSNPLTQCSNCTLTTNAPSSIPDPPQRCQFCNFNWLAKLGVHLLRFDIGWTSFEKQYINELIEIERISRRLVTFCIELDDELSLYEMLYSNLSTSKNENEKQLNPNDDDPDTTNSTDKKDLVGQQIERTYEKLIRTVAELNTAANSSRKGRGDYSYDIFRTAFDISARAVTEFQAVTRNPKSRYLNSMGTPDTLHESWPSKLSSVEIQCLAPITIPLIDDILSLRAYFRQAGQCPERIDPHLAQNANLVHHLYQLEASWDRCKPYLESDKAAKRLTHYLLFVRDAVDVDTKQADGDTVPVRITNVSPNRLGNRIITTSSKCVKEGFHDLVAACDVAAFLAIPRLVVLSYLTRPASSSPNTRLIEQFLPTDLVVPIPAMPSSQSSLSHEQATAYLPNGTDFFLAQTKLITERGTLMSESLQKAAYRAAQITCVLQQIEAKPIDYQTTWLQVIEYCIHGEVATKRNNHEDQLQAAAALDQFLKALEEASIMLQRTDPTEWNSFLQVVVICLQSSRVMGQPSQQGTRTEDNNNNNNTMKDASLMREGVNRNFA